MLGHGENGRTYAIGDNLVMKRVTLKSNRNAAGVAASDVQSEVDTQVALNQIGVGPVVHVDHEEHDPSRGAVVMQRLYPLADEKNKPQPIFCMPPQFQHELVAQVFRMVRGGYLHNDLHAGNVMMTREGHPVIIDFGLCTQVRALAETDDRRLIEQCALSQLQMLCDPSNLNTWVGFVSRDEGRVLSMDELEAAELDVHNMCTGERAEAIRASALTDHIYALRSGQADYNKINAAQRAAGRRRRAAAARRI